MVRQIRRDLRPAGQGCATKVGPHLASGRNVRESARRVLAAVADGRRTRHRTGLQKQRDKAATKRFSQRVLRSFPAPRKIVIDPLCSYPAAKADIPALANVKHVFVKAAARVNNRAENSHQPPRERERRMRGFRDPTRTQAFLESFGLIRQHFALKRHLLRASLYRKHLAARLSTWCELAEVTQKSLCRMKQTGHARPLVNILR